LSLLLTTNILSTYDLLNIHGIDLVTVGRVGAWEFFSAEGSVGKYLKFSVVRQLSGDCQFAVIGSNTVRVAAEGYNRVHISKDKKILAEEGDLIAMSFSDGASLRYYELMVALVT